MQIAKDDNVTVNINIRMPDGVLTSGYIKDGVIFDSNNNALYRYELATSNDDESIYKLFNPDTGEELRSLLIMSDNEMHNLYCLETDSSKIELPRSNVITRIIRRRNVNPQPPVTPSRRRFIQRTSRQTPSEQQAIQQTPLQLPTAFLLNSHLSVNLFEEKITIDNLADINRANIGAVKAGTYNKVIEVLAQSLWNMATLDPRNKKAGDDAQKLLDELWKIQTEPHYYSELFFRHYDYCLREYFGTRELASQALNNVEIWQDTGRDIRQKNFFGPNAAGVFNRRLRSVQSGEHAEILAHLVNVSNIRMDDRVFGKAFGLTQASRRNIHATPEYVLYQLFYLLSNPIAIYESIPKTRGSGIEYTFVLPAVYLDPTTNKYQPIVASLCYDPSTKIITIQTVYNVDYPNGLDAYDMRGVRTEYTDTLLTPREPLDYFKNLINGTGVFAVP